MTNGDPRRTPPTVSGNQTMDVAGKWRVDLRNATIEECARVAEEMENQYYPSLGIATALHDVAAAIRALKDR